ncbi:succinylglutamate desuccinylase/aspartoacylase family protein [Phytoactinopolyspora halophila]|uniref:succinylglutamate desuccinylase/aspartoacylase family protein n=1 Tax=Phytoactinopolyspora halophila TaxID=1981511 RepID=UPI00131446CF|nr:succinylglutamate desuccinylase/aspartoacylase family protein [Phytoactinopolyspora halophila]
MTRPLAGDVVLTAISGPEPGPTLAVLGGVHGDEDEGVLAVQRVTKEVSAQPQRLRRGTILAIARANPSGWAAQDRHSPVDGSNLARSFPGSPDDGPTAAIASAITTDVLAESDALIDLHSAGLRYRMPLMVGYCEDTSEHKRSRELAEAFAVPTIWVHPTGAAGRSLSAAAQLGVPAIYAECSGGGSIRAHELDAYTRGVFNVMTHLGMSSDTLDMPTRPPRWVRGDGDLDDGFQATHHGFFVSSAAVGEFTAANSEIGRFYDFDGNFLHYVNAHADGVLMFLRRQARTQAGDVLFVLAQPSDMHEAYT